MQLPVDKGEKFVTYWTRYEPRVFAYIYTLLPNWSDAQDVLQETSLVLWRKLDEFTENTDFVSWACRVAYFEVKKYLHRRHTQKLLLSESFAELLAQRMNERPDYLESVLLALGPCMEKLSQLERTLIQEHYIKGETVQSAAAHVGRSADAAYKSLQRVRRKLFDCVQRAIRREELL